MIEVGSDVSIAHLFCKFYSLVNITRSLCETSNKELEHETNVARFRNAAVIRMNFSELHLEKLKQRTGIVFHKYLLNQDQRLLEKNVMLTHSDLIL